MGLVLGLAATQGRDKVTFILSPALEALGGWLEQLLAESTGKAGRGMIPVAGEAPDVPEPYGDDRPLCVMPLHGWSGPAPASGETRVGAEPADDTCTDGGDRERVIPSAIWLLGGLATQRKRMWAGWTLRSTAASTSQRAGRPGTPS